MEGGWQNILLTHLKDFGGIRTFSLQKEKYLQVAQKISNPFWKDVFNSLYLAKPSTEIDIRECLSLDILNFVPLDDFPFYIRWANEGIKNLCHIVDELSKDFLSFEQISQKFRTKNFIRYYNLTSNIPKEIKVCIR